MIRLTKAAFLQSEGESNKSEMSCFYSLRKILTVKKRLIFFFFFFLIDPVIVHPLEPLKQFGIVFSDDEIFFASTNVCEYAH